MAVLEPRRNLADPSTHYLVLGCKPVGKVRRFTSSEPYITARLARSLRERGWAVAVFKSLPAPLKSDPEAV